MPLEIILEVKYPKIFNYQLEYLIKNKNYIDTIHVINSTNDTAFTINLQILSIKHNSWIKPHICKTNIFDYIDENFNIENIKYIFISQFICWQEKNLIEKLFFEEIEDFIVMPQIFNTDRIIYLHQVMGFLKTFTFRPWDDDYIDYMRPEEWDPRVYHYLHNNYINLIENNNFEEIKFEKYYFNDKEHIPGYLFCWQGSRSDKKYYIKGNAFASVVSPNYEVLNYLSEYNYLNKYETILRKQFEPIIKQLELDLNIKKTYTETKQLELAFEFDSNEIAFSKKIIKFAINSNINQNKKILNTLILSLIKNNISSKNIIVFIGGCNENKIEIIDGITYHYVTHNSYDHTAIISIIEENYVSDYWFCMHDTCEAGKKFYENLLNFKIEYHSSVLEAGWLNMGMFSQEFIVRNKEYILKLKNCNKMRAILSEQIYSRLGDDSFYNSRKNTKIQGKADIYNDDVERLIIYFSDLDLYKYQSFHYNSEYTRQLKEKYTIDILKLT